MPTKEEIKRDTKRIKKEIEQKKKDFPGIFDVPNTL